jgi:hypothetical protein
MSPQFTENRRFGLTANAAFSKFARETSSNGDC